ncbi:carbonic anhydrase [Monosporozyma unispora]|nr:hypothetical protein C6P44_004853 [Kazachstania unispora]
MGTDILQTIPLKHTHSSSNLLSKNEKWVNKTFPTAQLNNTTSFSPFGSKVAKHEPHTFFLGCSDARYNESCLGFTQGEVFTVKTIANIFREDDISTEAALEYAIDCVGVKQIIICGHTDCGGINTCLLKRRDLLPKAKLNKLYSHLNDIDDLLLQYNDYINERTQGDINNLLLKGKILAMLNVQLQINKVKNLDVVQRAMEHDGLKIHGLIYNVDTHLVEKIDL